MNAHDIHAMREIGKWGDLARYYVDADGIAWSYSSCTGGLSCKGPINEFRDTFAARCRGELYPEKVQS